MKKFFTLFLTLMTSVMLWAYDFQSGDLYYNITSNVAPYTIEVTSGNIDYSGDITIPSSVTYNGITYAVTSIRNAAFNNCSSLTSVTIPESVTNIGERAFYNCSSLTAINVDTNNPNYSSVDGVLFNKDKTKLIQYPIGNARSEYTIPNTVTSIGDYAFSYCSSLTSVTIPNSVTSIGGSICSDCSSLTSINVDTNNPNYSSVDGVLFNKDQTTLIKYPIGNTRSEYTIPNTVTSIKIYAFSGCSKLTSVTIPNSVTSIELWAFSHCSSLTSVTIPNSVITIGQYAFYSCSSLTSVTIGSGVTSIGHSAFGHYCPSLATIVVENGNTKYDSRGDCNAIIETTSNTLIQGCKNTIIPNTITSIGECAFLGCSSLTSITIPNSVTSIGIQAFYACSSLTSITIPESVTSIGNNAFNNSYRLTSITCKASVPPTLGEEPFDPYLTAYIPCGTTAAYETSEWKQYVAEFIEEGCIDPTWQILYTSSDGNVVTPYDSDVFGANIVSNEYKDGQGIITFDGPVTSIGESAFFGCSSLTSITIPNSVTSIGGGAFNDCSSLTSVTIPNSVKSIENYAFSDCSSLTSVTIPNSVKSIGFYAFSNCSSLTSITIPNSVISIGDYAFSDCSSLTGITIPKGVTSIGKYTFLLCSSLTSIVVENGNTNYDSRGDCNAIIETTSNTLIQGCKNTIIPNTVTSIGDWVFSGCSSLTSITIPNGVTSIGENAFHGCSSLTSITIPEGVTSIGDQTFFSCSSLANITLHDGITSIGDRAFGYCSSLTSITIPKSVNYIGQYTFQSCSALTSITCKATTPPDLGLRALIASELKTAYIPCGTKAAYEASDWASYSSISFVEEGCIDPTWQILYTSTDGNIVTPNKPDVFGANIVSNEYQDGQGIITFDGPVISIGEDAFYQRGLTSITIPSSVTSIGDQAFFDCLLLASITIPEGITNIGDQVFENCSALNSFTIPNSVTNIGYAAFRHCSALTSITLPKGILSIGDHAFVRCSSLTSLSVPKSVISIGEAAFASCSSLTSIVVENGNTNYDSRGDCNAIIETASNTLIKGCKNTIIPNTITSIGEYAFTLCSDLTSIIIPNSVTSIGYGAFYGCSSLTLVTIPSSVTSIGNRTFEDCSSLNTIYVEATTPPELGTGTFTGTPSPVCHIPCGTKAAYEASAWASQVSEFVEECEEYTITYTSTDGNIVIPNKADALGANIVSNTYENGVGTITFDGPITTIGQDAFYNRKNLTSVTIPKSVETIGQDAFRDCKALTNVTISNGVMKIGGGAFIGCSSLTSVFIPSSVTSIGGNPFVACPGIISIVVDENNPKYDSRNNCNGIIETAANRLISGCQNTIIPYGVTDLDNAFWECSSLKEITIPNTVTNIGTFTFECCSLTSIVIPKSVTSIGYRAFNLCPLSTIVVEEGNPKYDSRNNCNAIIETSTNTLLTGSDNTIIPEGITAISPGAFRGIKHIASIAIPNSVTRIGEYAFDGCTSLTSITIPDGVTVIKHFAFSFCDALTSVIIGKGVNSVEQGAFIMSPIETVYFNAQEPAIGMDLWTGYRYFSSSPTCYIPCGTKAAYEASVWNDYMESFIETYECTLTLSSSDNSMGSATITQEPACGTPAIIVATPNDGYFFSQWSDGNTDNPRTLTVTEDMELAAEFEEIGDYGSYSRNVRIGYNTICLPHGSRHFTGATFYEIAHILKNKKKIFFDEVKTLEAGKPYIFYPHSNEVTVYYDNTTSAIPLSHNGLHGTFDGITAASNFLKGKYLVVGDRMVLCGNGCSLAANRAYIELDEISDKDHPAIPGIKRVSMDYSEENATTALDNITDESIVAPIQEGVYDILGRKVDAPTVSGFYIINGKKVFVAL